MKELEEWIPHMRSLGCNSLYIGPLFESSTHGYDTRDYKLVDRRLGDNDGFRHFIKACHEAGIRVVVDGVFNHTGREFFAFQDIQKNRENSPYRDWYRGVNFGWGSPMGDSFGYEAWQGHYELPCLNLWNPEVRQYLFDVIRFWIDEFDIDGIRLDCANVLDFNFMKEMRAQTATMKPDFWLMGEVIHGEYSRWVNPEMLHSVTNYELHKGLYSGHNDHNYFEIAHTMRRLQGLCHDTRLYNFSDNHDVERLPNKLRNRDHIRHIALLVYTLWGIPSIYYGSEFGIEGKKEWGSDWPLRPCLELADYADAEKTNPVTSVYAALGRRKAECPALSWGEVKELTLTTQSYAYARVLDGEAVVAVYNNGDSPVSMELQLPVEAADVKDLLADCVGSQPILTQVEWGKLKVQLPSNYATLLQLV